jgi:hypothetical protein
MSNITKNHKVGIFAIFIASALMLGTISVSGIDSAFATKDRSSDNEAEQEIEQTQVSKQDSQCIDVGAVVVSALNCNNVALQLQANLGSNGLAQE